MVLIPYWISGGIGRWFEMQLKGRVGARRHICWSFLNTCAFDYIHPCTHTGTHIFYLFRRCLCASALALCTSNHAILSGMHSFYHSLALQLFSTLPSLWVIWHLPLHYYTLALRTVQELHWHRKSPREGKAHLSIVLRTCPTYPVTYAGKYQSWAEVCSGLAWPQNVAPEAVSSY